ncbi:MAG: thioester reductase domain-containing protein, partial [Acidobacteriota bacterium]
VGDAVVVAEGNQRLIGYAVSANDEPLDVATVRHELTEHLPGHMVPAVIVAMTALPLTPNGKVDRKALPSPDAAQIATAAYVAPRNDDEVILAQIWATVLELPQVGVDDDFFALGGHSLAATEVVYQLRSQLDLEVPVRTLFERPTVASLAQAIDHLRRTGELPAGTDTDLVAEAVLDPSIEPDPALPVVTTGDRPRSVFLTGATGFLGTYLLADLLTRTDAEVCCLVRADNEAAGRRRLVHALEAHDLEVDVDRVVPIVGDLGQPRFGLSEAAFAALGERVDTIVHNGAWVNHVFPYAVLRAANVGGTAEVLRLAVTGRTKPVHAVSTLSVFRAPEHGPVLAEDDPLDHPAVNGGGYGQSKWVAEKLLKIARARGIEVSVYRPGRVGWATTTGRWNADDALCLAVRACLELGVVPEVDLRFDLTPVDWVAEAIIGLMLDPGSRQRDYHLVTPDGMAWRDLFDWLITAGHTLTFADPATWHTQVTAAAGDNEQLAALGQLLDGEARGGGTQIFDDANLRADLPSTVTTKPTLDATSVRVMAAHLTRDTTVGV